MTSALSRRLSGARPVSCLIRLLFGALQHEGGLNERDPAVLRLHEILRHKHTVRCAPQGHAAPPRTEPLFGQGPGRSHARRGRDAAKRRPAGERTQLKGVFCHRLGSRQLGRADRNSIEERGMGGGGGGRQGGDAHVLPYLHQAPDPSATRGGRSGRGFPVSGRGVFSLMKSRVATRARCTASVSTDRPLSLDPQQRHSRKTSSVRLQQHLCGPIAGFQLRFLVNRSNASSRKFSARD